MIKDLISIIIYVLSIKDCILVRSGTHKHMYVRATVSLNYSFISDILDGMHTFYAQTWPHYGIATCDNDF